jgi:hypothetical protein
MIGFGLNIGNRVMGGGGGFDADAQAFFDRVTTAGGSLTTTEKNATNQLVLDMKSAGIWSSMKAVYPMVGASAAACAQNLKSSSFTGTFTSGWTFASTGATPNGTSAYFDTTLNGRSVLGNQRHFGFYNNTNTNGVVHMGSINNVDGGQDYIGLGTFQNYRINTLGTNTGLTSSSKGLLINRSNSTNVDLFLNGSSAQTSLGVVVNTVNANYYLACAPLNQNFGDTRYAFASIGDGLTDTQASNFYTAVQAFQTTLGRQIAP